MFVARHRMRRLPQWLGVGSSKPNTRSTRVPIHLISPVARWRPLKYPYSLPEAADHSMFMLSRFTKKSFVNVSGRSVRIPNPDWQTFVSRTRKPPTRTVISGAVSVSICARSTSNSSAVLFVPVCKVVTKSVCGRFKHSKRFDIGLLLQRIRASRSKRHFYFNIGVLRSCLDRCIIQRERSGQQARPSSRRTAIR